MIEQIKIVIDLGLASVLVIYAGIVLFVTHNNSKHPENKLLYPWEVPEPDDEDD